MASKTTYFVPQGYEEELRAAKLSFSPAIAETADREGPPFRIPGFVMTGNTSTIEAAFKELEFESFIECRVGNRIHKLAVGLKGDSVAKIDAEYGLYFDEDAEGAFADTYLVNAVMDVSTWISKPLDLHISHGRTVPPSDSERLLVVLNGRPPGEPVEIEVKKVCGIELGSLSYRTHCTAGLGELVRDGDTVVGQIVGNTLYVFFDMNPASVYLLGIRGAGVRLFERMLALVWNRYYEGLPAPELPQDTDPDELREAVASWVPAALEKAEEQVAHAQQALRAAEVAYRERLTDYMAVIAVRNGVAAFPSLHAEYLGDAQAQRRAWEELRTHPSVASIALVGGGVNLTTHPLFLHYEGHRYRLGTFVLRLTVTSDLYVWCENSPHKKRVPHPHVSEDGTMCYGNVALTIERTATLERNYPKTFRMALELLTEGYDPRTTLTPITEWPEEPDE